MLRLIGVFKLAVEVSLSMPGHPSFFFCPLMDKLAVQGVTLLSPRGIWVGGPGPPANLHRIDKVPLTG